MSCILTFVCIWEFSCLKSIKWSILLLNFNFCYKLLSCHRSTLFLSVPTIHDMNIKWSLLHILLYTQCITDYATHNTCCLSLLFDQIIIDFIYVYCHTSRCVSWALDKTLGRDVTFCLRNQIWYSKFIRTDKSTTFWNYLFILTEMC